MNKEPKEYNIKPTEKQKRYLKNKIDNGGNKYKALKDAGYSEAMAINPAKVENSKGFQELLEFYFPDDFLLQEHKKNITQDQDKGAKNKALDNAYKLKNKYPKEQGEFEAGSLKITISKSD